MPSAFGKSSLSGSRPGSQGLAQPALRSSTPGSKSIPAAGQHGSAPPRQTGSTKLNTKSGSSHDIGKK